MAVHIMYDGQIFKGTLYQPGHGLCLIVPAFQHQNALFMQVQRRLNGNPPVKIQPVNACKKGHDRLFFHFRLQAAPQSIRNIGGWKR